MSRWPLLPTPEPSRDEADQAAVEEYWRAVKQDPTVVLARDQEGALHLYRRDEVVVVTGRSPMTRPSQFRDFTLLAGVCALVALVVAPIRWISVAFVLFAAYGGWQWYRSVRAHRGLDARLVPPPVTRGEIDEIWQSRELR